MKQTEIKITRFKDGEYFIDIVDDGKTYEAWISESDEANQMFMFGVSQKNESFDRFCKVVESNLPKYKALYQCIKLGEE